MMIQIAVIINNNNSSNKIYLINMNKKQYFQHKLSKLNNI